MPSPPVGFRYALIPSRDETFTAASWWLIDRSHEPPLTQGATALAEHCLQKFPHWNETFVRRVLKAYRQFLGMLKITQDWTCAGFLPPPLVEQIWAIHRQNVVSYCHDCMTLLGRVVGYNIVHDDDVSTIRSKQSERRALTLQTLKEHYGSDIDEELWTYKSSCTLKMTDTDQATAHKSTIALSGAFAKERDAENGSTSGIKEDTELMKGNQRPKMVTEVVQNNNFALSRQDIANPLRTASDATTVCVDATIANNNSRQVMNLKEDDNRSDSSHEADAERLYSGNMQMNELIQGDDCTLIPDLAEQSIPNSFSNDQIDSPHSGEADDEQFQRYHRQCNGDEEDESMGRKDARLVRNDDDDEDDRSHQSDDFFPDLTICVCYEGNRASRTWFKVRPDTRMGMVFENIPYLKFGVNAENATFFLHDRRDIGMILAVDTAQTLELQNGDMIDMVAPREGDVEDESAAEDFEEADDGKDAVEDQCQQLRGSHEFQPGHSPEDEPLKFIESLVDATDSAQASGQASGSQRAKEREVETVPLATPEEDDCLVIKVVKANEDGVAKGNREKGPKTKTSRKGKARRKRPGEVVGIKVDEKPSADLAKNGKVANASAEHGKDEMTAVKKLDLPRPQFQSPKNSAKRKEARKLPATRSSRRQRKEEPEIAPG
jgi:hypothetical protein